MKYFTKREFECHDGCKMPVEVEANIRALVDNVLDPVRERLGQPIKVNSGYRCPRHNQKVGGVVNSQHMKGEAADVTCSDVSRLKKLIREIGKYDQLIDYGSFIHVSHKRNGTNRRQTLKKG